MTVGYQYYSYSAPYPVASNMLSRSQSSLTLSSSDSSSQEYQASPNFQSQPFMPPSNQFAMKSEPDLTHIDTTPNSRQRSQSSPQVLGDMLSPSSGKVIKVRPSPGSLSRQNSYNGSSPSPRRPVPLSRANSSQGGIRRSRPGSLAASAFGLTPLPNDYLPSSPSSMSSHSRQRSDVSLGPTTSYLSGMTLSPDMSERGDIMPIPLAVPPLTPITPGYAATNAVFPNTDFGEIQRDPQVQFATMPNKHYAATHYVQQQQYYGYNTQEQGQWH
jgi:hypothetical protein